MATKKESKQPKTSAKGGHASGVNWKELYQDLPENVAAVLRDKRVKPEQLTAKEDGEILALGLSDVDLETIRAKYPALAVNEVKETKVEAEAVKPAKVKSDSHFYKYPRHIYGRSTRYQALAKKINRNLTYAPQAALEQIIASAAGKDRGLDLHVNTLETGLRGEIKVPFSTGKAIRIEIFSDQTITALNNNEFNFDVLLATPADMPKLAKYAKILGPKGLMPNPKNGTISPNPEAAAKKFAGGLIHYKSEPKAPLMHLVVGKLSFKDKDLIDNLKAVITAVAPKNISAAFICSSMSPSIKLNLQDQTL